MTVIDELCGRLAAAYDEAGHGFQLAKVAGGWRYQTHADLSPYVERFLLDGQRACGIALRGKDGPVTYRARREVILASGAIGSPVILQHSGIGNGDVLKSAGVDVAHHLPGVGMIYRAVTGSDISAASDFGTCSDTRLMNSR